MCGICGFVISEEKYNVSDVNDNSTIISMLNLIEHRGPDNTDFYHNLIDNHVVGLGSVRLSILDKSEKSNMPFIDGSRVLVYNGEIYNYKELSVKYNIKFTGSDGAFLFAFLGKFGDEKLSELNGMFAFAYYNGTELFLVRDMLGIKPLYVLEIDGGVVFSSEIKPILLHQMAIANNSAKVQINRGLDYVNNGFLYGGLTFYDKIYKLEGGTFLKYQTQSLKLSKHQFRRKLDFTLIDKARERLVGVSREKYKNDLRFDLEVAVQKHCISDAPMGVIASGGVDSSLIALFASKISKGIPLYHADHGLVGSELLFARNLAKKIESEVVVVPFGRKDYLDSFVDSIYYNEFPHYHPSDIPLYLVCNQARIDGVKVLLCGEGADEIFSGYRPYNNLYSRYRFANNDLIKKIAPYLKLIYNKFKIIENISFDGNGRFANILNLQDNSLNRRLLVNNLLTQSFFQRIENYERDIININDYDNDFESVARGFFCDRINGHLETLLHRNDTMGMWASVETRVPFLDSDIFEKYFWVDRIHKSKTDSGHMNLKFYLKEILSESMGKKFANRPKQGFPIPLDSWLKRDSIIFRDGFLINELGLNIGQKILSSVDCHHLFYLINLEIWGRLFVLNQSRSEIQNKFNVSQSNF